MSDSTGRKPLAVYAIIERKEGQKPYWMKIGAAFENRDQSLTLLLDAYPAGAHKLQVREQREWERPGGAPPGEPEPSAAGGPERGGRGGSRLNGRSGGGGEVAP